MLLSLHEQIRTLILVQQGVCIFDVLNSVINELQQLVADVHVRQILANFVQLCQTVVQLGSNFRDIHGHIFLVDGLGCGVFDLCVEHEDQSAVED